MSVLFYSKIIYERKAKNTLVLPAFKLIFSYPNVYKPINCTYTCTRMAGRKFNTLSGLGVYSVLQEHLQIYKGILNVLSLQRGFQHLQIFKTHSSLKVYTHENSALNSYMKWLVIYAKKDSNFRNYNSSNTRNTLKRLILVVIRLTSDWDNNIGQV